MLRSLALGRLPRSLPPAHRRRRRRFFFSSFSSSSSPPPAADNDDVSPSVTTAAERSITSILTSKLSPTKLLVQDVSGGCGTMYAIHVTSPLFRGQSLLQQQRMVNGALGDLVKAWHGLHLRTSVPKDDGGD